MACHSNSLTSLLFTVTNTKIPLHYYSYNKNQLYHKPCEKRNCITIIQTWNFMPKIISGVEMHSPKSEFAAVLMPFFFLSVFYKWPWQVLGLKVTVDYCQIFLILCPLSAQRCRIHSALYYKAHTLINSEHVYMCALINRSLSDFYSEISFQLPDYSSAHVNSMNLDALSGKSHYQIMENLKHTAIFFAW